MCVSGVCKLALEVDACVHCQCQGQRDSAGPLSGPGSKALPVFEWGWGLLGTATLVLVLSLF